MLKKLLKAATTFTLLVGCYFGYVHAFAILVEQLRTARPENPSLFPFHDSKSKQKAAALAKATLGDDHWSVINDQPYGYYNAERGFWMYTLNVEEITEEDGVQYDRKRLRMTPVAIIMQPSDGKSIQVLTGKRAILDLNQAVGLGSNKPGTESLKVKHARIEEDVYIRDDRGTPRNRTDDMVVGPLTSIEFDEATQEITTDSHVVIRDPDTLAIGDGMMIQLRKQDPNAVARPSSGFGGAEYAILRKKVQVVLRDVGKSGFLPGSPPSRKDATKAVDLKVESVGVGPDQKKAQPAPADELTPLDIRSDGPMRVDLAAPRTPVEEGPPEPPAPTKVQFDRNVVALHGQANRQPNQLNCDSLRLTLVPAGKPPQKRDSSTGKDKAPVQGAVQAGSGVATAQTGTPAGAVAQTEAGRDGKGADSQPKPGSETTGAAVGEVSNPSLFGDLTLQKAYATGHAVWLQLREQGVKVRCNELIHERRLPYQSDTTYFRGDLTRLIWLEKIDRAPAEADVEKTAKSDTPDAGKPAEDDRATNRSGERKVTSVTHVVTLDATLFDNGSGLDLADVVARGPGRLESRPDLMEPVERIVKWQDKLIVQNMATPEGQLLKKRIDLTGTRPSFEDTVQKTTLDSGEQIIVWLKPKPPAKEAASSDQATGGTARTLANAGAGGPGDTTSVAGAGLGGGGLQIEYLQAFRDVHFVAPNRRIEARRVLDAPFVEAEPKPKAVVASTTPAAAVAEPGGTAETAPAPAPARGKDAAQGQGQAPTQVAAQDPEKTPPAGPAMTGVADRVWAKVALKPGSSLDSRSSKRRATATTTADTMTASTDSPVTATARTASGSPDSDAEIREAWMRGNVAFHQDAAPGKTKDGATGKAKGDDITGEALYLDNRGEGKVLARVYHRDPTDPARRPGPIPLAMVSTDDRTIRGEILRMDQEHDKVWGDGPGTLTQWTDRSLLTDKAPEPAANPDGTAAAPAASAAPTARSQSGAPGSDASPPSRGTRLVTRTDPAAEPNAPAGPAPASRPKTRAGRPVGDKDLLTITWTQRMEFTGRTTDGSGRPAGRADFFGHVNALMEDAQLECDQKMIVFTDREVPLAQLGSLSKAGGSDGTPANEDLDVDGESKARTKTDLALIYCFGNALGVSRKIDPDAPIVNQQQIILADQRLDYNRRTGEFFVKGPGQVYLWDRSGQSSETSGNEAGLVGDTTKSNDRVGNGPNPGRATRTGRIVTPTSGRTTGARPAVGPESPATAISRRPATAGTTRNPAQTAQPAAPPITRKIPPLILTQIFFVTGMRGRFGTGQENDIAQERWSEFFGDIQLRRAEVPHLKVAFDFDQPLSSDGFFLTSQILRVIQEPPPAGAPASTPARTFIKAWDNVTVNKGETSALQADIGTYDSASDRLYAYGEGNRGVVLVQQEGVGQPESNGYGKALEFNVKSGAGHFINSDFVRGFDKRTGTRPGHVPPPDPNAKPKKKVKPLFRIAPNNMERRGFSGQ